jgi:hypothetical protein
MSERYCLVRDYDRHWFVITVDCKADWIAKCDTFYEACRTRDYSKMPSDFPPKWAHPIDGTDTLTFENWS